MKKWFQSVTVSKLVFVEMDWPRHLDQDKEIS